MTLGARCRVRTLLAVSILTLVGAAASARAATVTCVAGGSIGAPLDYADPATWNPPVVPDASSDVLLSAACAVRCNAGTCHANTLKGTHAAASLEIAPGAALELAGCDTSSAYALSTYQCGGEGGFRFAPQGALVHDSAVDGDPIVRGAALPAQPDRLRLVLSNSIGAAIGDWLQVRSGPSRSHVHRVVDVDVSGCPNPSACHFTVALHDPDMEFGTNAQTSGYATGIGYLDTMRIAAPDHPSYDALRLDRCVEVCTQRTGPHCTGAATVGADGSYVGWYLGVSDAAQDPADPAVMQRRMLVVETQHGVDEAIGGTGNVDRVCFADPLPASWIPATGHADRSAVVWPGFWPGDAWVLFRPAEVRYAGAEGDGGLGFHGACVDSDFAYFDGWSKIAVRTGTPACQRPFQDTVVVAWAQGLAGVPVDQQAGCNGHSLDVLSYGALAGDRVALVDSRTPVDTSGTCYTSFDPASDSGTHGLALAGTSFDAAQPPAEWLIRHAGDDGIFIGGDGLGAVTWTFPRWTWWWNKHGVSTEVIDFLDADPGQIVRVEDARVVMYAGSPGCKGALDDPTSQVEFQIDGMLYVDPRHPGPLIGLGAAEGHDVTGLLAFGSTTSNCAALRSARVRDSWLEGWNRLVQYLVRDVDGVRFAARGGGASGSVFGWLPAGASVDIHDFVVSGIPAIPLVAAACGAGCDLSMRNGFASWASPSSLGVSNFYDTATVHLVDPLEGLLFENARLLNCSAGWGESGAMIGRNLLVAAPAGAAIGNPATCPLAAEQKLLAATGLAAKLPFRATLAGETFGPMERVGLAANAAVLTGADLVGPFAIGEEPCANGVDDDWDGAADLADAGCSDAADASERRSGVACDDGIDNDGDGLADAGFDPGCPMSASGPENPACDDGVDNDGDGQVDFADPNCSAQWPWSEASRSACGLGFEAVLLALLARRLARASAARRDPRTS